MTDKEAKDLAQSSRRNKRLVDDVTRAHYGTTVDELSTALCNLCNTLQDVLPKGRSKEEGGDYP